LQSPNGVTLNSKSPSVVQKAVFYFLIVGVHLNLPTPANEIKGAEPFSTGQRAEGVIDPRKRVGVLPVVHTESCRPIFRTKTTGDAQGLLEG